MKLQIEIDTKSSDDINKLRKEISKKAMRNISRAEFIRDAIIEKIQREKGLKK